LKIKPAQATLNELRDGEVMNELAQAIHDATGAAQHFRKPATVTLSITFKPMGTEGVSDAFAVIAEVDTKLPKAQPPITLMFIDEDGNTSRQQTRQSEIAFSVAPNVVKPSIAS
jgi:5,10-methenyltetrahydromethanopterin hydrogenase